MTRLPIDDSIDLLVSSDSSDDLASWDNSLAAHFGVLLETHCRLCLNSVSVSFDLGVRLEAQPEWKEQTVLCPHCNQKMLVRIQYYVKANLG